MCLLRRRLELPNPYYIFIFLLSLFIVRANCHFIKIIVNTQASLAPKCFRRIFYNDRRRFEQYRIRDTFLADDTSSSCSILVSASSGVCLVNTGRLRCFLNIHRDFSLTKLLKGYLVGGSLALPDYVKFLASPAEPGAYRLIVM